jgi:hypothetical protein
VASEYQIGIQVTSIILLVINKCLFETPNVQISGVEHSDDHYHLISIGFCGAEKTE